MDTKNEKPLGLYIHIPFCRSKCEYCDFYSVAGGRNKEMMDSLQHALVKHFREASKRTPNHIVDSIYFGGGTPSFYGAKRLKWLLREIEKRFRVSNEAEITLEANPDSLDPKTLRTLFRAGFNRISIGMQSDSDEQLKALGRPHTFEQAKNAALWAREAGFENISIDLMYGLPNQTRSGWAQTLRAAMALKPTHLSCYALKIEEGTPMHDYQHCINLPDDDMQADMYLYAVETLENFGYMQYEISNFAREGYACRHNIKYWTGGEYMSFGPAASSDFGGKRYTFYGDLETYIDGVVKNDEIISECEDVPIKDRAGEYLMLRTRTAKGIEESEYRSAYLAPFEPLENLMKSWQNQGLSEQNGGRWRLTPKGFLLSNSLILELIDAQTAAVPRTRRYGQRQQAAQNTADAQTVPEDSIESAGQ